MSPTTGDAPSLKDQILAELDRRGLGYDPTSGQALPKHLMPGVASISALPEGEFEKTKAANVNSWGEADPLRGALYSATGYDELFSPEKGIETYVKSSRDPETGIEKQTLIQEPGIRSKLATALEMGGGIAGGIGAGALTENPFGAAAGYTAGELGGRGLTRAMNLRPSQDLNSEAPIGILDDYKSLNPLTNPALMNFALPGAGKLAGKALSSIEERQLAKAAGLEEAMLGVDPKIDYKPGKLYADDVPKLIESGVFNKASTAEDLANALAARKEELGSKIGDLVDAAEQARINSGGAPLKVNFSNAEEFVKQSSPAIRDDLAAQLDELKASFDKHLTGDLKDLHKQKSATQRIAFKSPKKDPDLLQAVAQDIKEATNQAIDSSMTDASGASLISPVNEEYARLSRISKPIDRLVGVEAKANQDPLRSGPAQITKALLSAYGGSSLLGPGAMLPAGFIPMAISKMQTVGGRRVRANLAKAIAEAAKTGGDVSSLAVGDRARLLAQALRTLEEQPTYEDYSGQDNESEE